MEFRIYVEIVLYVEIVPLARNSLAGTLEWFPFCTNSVLLGNCILHKNCPSGTSEFISFWHEPGFYLGVKIPGDSLSRIPLCFRWCHRINSFWLQLGSSLEFPRGHLGINSVWRQLTLPLGFSIPGDSFSGFLLVFPRLGLFCLFVRGGLHFPPLGAYYYYPFLGYYISYTVLSVKMSCFICCMQHCVL